MFSTCLVVGMFLATPEQTDIYYVELDNTFNPVDLQLRLSELVGYPVISVREYHLSSLRLLGAKFAPCKYYASLER